MTVPCQGKITFADIKNEFQHMIKGDPNKLSSYYGVVAGIPKSGILKFSDFRCKTAKITKHITQDTNNVSGNSYFTYEELQSGADLELIVDAGVTVGATSTLYPAISMIAPLLKQKIIIVNNGTILGAGGTNLNYDKYGNKYYGGTALKLFAKKVEVINNGTLYAGGGAGGFGGKGGNGGNGEYFYTKKDTHYQSNYSEWVLNYPSIGKYCIFWEGNIVRTGNYTVDTSSSNNVFIFDGISSNTLQIDGKNFTLGNVKNTREVWLNNYGYLVSNCEIINSYEVRVATSGGEGGVATGMVMGRGYNNLNGSLNPFPQNAGQAGGQNAGWGGSSGISGGGGDWGQAGTFGQKGNYGGNGNVSSGTEGSSGGERGIGGYFLHQVKTNNSDPDSDYEIEFVNNGNLQGVYIQYEQDLHFG